LIFESLHFYGVLSLFLHCITGKIITAAYVPLPNYHSLFPEAHRATQLLLPSTQTLQLSGYSAQTSMFNGGLVR